MPYVTSGGYRIHYVVDGSPEHPTLVLINGHSNQLTVFDDEWVALFVDAGLQVVRFDHRDVGLSSETPHPPDLDAAIEAVVGGDVSSIPYSLHDMAADVVAVLDDIDVDQAHVLGVSMGGMIAQIMAIDHPHRMRSVISGMSTTGEAGYGQSTPEAQARFSTPTAADRQSYIADYVASLAIWGSPDHYDPDRVAALAAGLFDRSYRPHAGGHHTAAVLATPPRHEALARTTVPFLVIHGTHDTLLDISGGLRTAEIVPDAQFVAIEGMGHDYPPQLWPRWVAEVSAFVAEIEAR